MDPVSWDFLSLTRSYVFFYELSVLRGVIIFKVARSVNVPLGWLIARNTTGMSDCGHPYNTLNSLIPSSENRQGQCPIPNACRRDDQKGHDSKPLISGLFVSLPRFGIWVAL